MKRILPLLLVFAFLISACGTAGDTPGTGSGSGPSTSGVKSLVIGIEGDVTTWDVHNHTLTLNGAVQFNIFEGLVARDDNMVPQPRLAKSWSQPSDTVWRFELQDGVKFHNGDPFTAEDVKFSLDRVAFDDTLANNRYYTTIKEVRVIDPLTVEIETIGPDPIMLARLARTGGLILPKNYIEQVGWDGFQERPIGTGPYKVVSFVRDDRFNLEAFADYWRGEAAVKEVVFRVIPENSTRVAELLSGGVDLISRVPVQDVSRVKTDTTDAVPVDTPGVLYFGDIRFHDGYLTADKRVREAVDYAINRQLIIDLLRGGAGVPVRTRTTTPVFGANPALYNVDMYNPEKAQALVAEVAAELGETPRMGLLAQAAHKEIAETLAGMLEEVGFKIDLEVLDRTAFQQKRADLQHPELNLVASTNLMFDASLSIDPAKTENAAARSGYSNPRVDELIELATVNPDPESRAAQYMEAAELIAEDRFQIGLITEGVTYGVRKGVKWTARVDEVYDLFSMDIEER